MYCPGKTWVNWDECKVIDGVFTEIKFGHDEEAEYWASTCQAIMEETQTEMFRRMDSKITGKSTYDIGPVWAH